MCQGCGQARDLNVSISKYVSGSEYARVTQGSEYASGSEFTMVAQGYNCQNNF